MDKGEKDATLKQITMSFVQPLSLAIHLLWQCGYLKSLGTRDMVSDNFHNHSRWHDNSMETAAHHVH